MTQTIVSAYNPLSGPGIESNYWQMPNGDLLAFLDAQNTSVNHTQSYYAVSVSGVWTTLAIPTGSSSQIFLHAIARDTTNPLGFFAVFRPDSGSTLTGYKFTYSTTTHRLTRTVGPVTLSGSGSTMTFCYDGSYIHAMRIGTSVTIRRYSSTWVDLGISATLSSSSPLSNNSSIVKTANGTLFVVYGGYQTVVAREITYDSSSYSLGDVEQSYTSVINARCFVDETGAVDLILAQNTSDALVQQILRYFRNADGTYDSTNNQVLFKGPLASYGSGVSGTLLNTSGSRYVPVIAILGSVPQIFKRVEGVWTAWTTYSSLPDVYPINIVLLRSSGVALSGSTVRVLLGYMNSTGGTWAGSYTDSTDINDAPHLTLVSPASGTSIFDPSVDAIPLVWAYDDPDDAQTQYQRQVQISENYAGALVYYLTSSGTLSIGVQTVTTALLTATINAGQLHQSSYGWRWAVRASDIHGVFSAWTPFNVFAVSIKPTVAITAPASGVSVTSNHPFVTWTYTDPEATNQSGYRLKIYDVANVVLYDTGVVSTITGTTVISGGQGSHHLSGYALNNFSTYKVGVQAADASGLWSTEVKVTFSTNFIFPPASSVDVTLDANNIASIAVTAGTPASGQSDPYTVAVYRWIPRLEEYALLVTSVGSPTETFTDAGGPANATFRYKVTTSDIDDSSVDTISDDVYFTDDWRLLAGSTILSMDVDNFTANVSSASQKLEAMGRQHPITLVQKTRGREGTIRFWILESERSAVLATLKDLLQAAGVYIRTPYGDTYSAILLTPHLGEVLMGRISVDLPYIETGDA